MRWIVLVGLGACCPGAGLPPTPAEGAPGADLVPTASHAVASEPPPAASECSATAADGTARACPPAAAVTP